MGQCEMRRRTIRQHHLLHEGLDVDLVVGKIADIAFARVAQPPRRMALSAPVDHRHREAAVAQVPHRLEIFLDRLGAAREDADRALAARRRRPPREAQFRTVRRADGAGDDILRNGVGGNRDERHAGGRLGENGWKTRAGASKKGPSAALLNAVSVLPYHQRAGRYQCLTNALTGVWASGCTARKPGPIGGRVFETVAQWRTTYA